MKIEELLFAMCDDSTDYLDDATSSIKCGSQESDEGCCILNAGLLATSTITPSSTHAVTISSTSLMPPSSHLLTLSRITGEDSGGEGGGEQQQQSIRRVKSTPNLLQIPTPFRHRKRSDDSAVGSAEETESYRSNDSLPNDPSPSKKSSYSSYRHSCPQDNSSASSASSTAASSYKSSSITTHLRIITPPLFVTQPAASSSSPSSSSPITCSEQFQRSVSTSAATSSAAISAPKRISLTAPTLHISAANPFAVSMCTATSGSSSSSVAVTPTTPSGCFGPLGTDGKLLRPPSVVISDHDVCQEEGERFITLEELDAEFSEQQQFRRRFSDCSTCSSLSFSESDLTQLSNEEEAEEAAAVQRVSKSSKFFIHFVRLIF